MFFTYFKWNILQSSINRACPVISQIRVHLRNFQTRFSARKLPKSLIEKILFFSLDFFFLVETTFYEIVPSAIENTVYIYTQDT